MYEGQATIDTPIDDAYLRRYMSMAKFTALVSTQSLFFPTLWQLEDRREGTLPDHWSTEETGDFVAAIRNRIKVSCWHEEEQESDALWRLYALKEEAVAVRTTVGRLKEVLNRVETSCFLGRVEYAYYTGEPLRRDEDDGSTGPHYAFMCKRSSFAHEREVRAAILPDIVYAGPGDTSEPEPGVSLSIVVDRFIEKVIVSPYAEEWFCDAVRELMKRMGLDSPVEFSELR